MNLNTWDKLIEYNTRAAQTLPRTPEPSSVTDQWDSVNDYDQVMATNMTVNYSVILDIIYRARQNPSGGNVLDLCSGPGHLSTCIAHYLNYHTVTGVDLSQPMVDVANRNARSRNLSTRLSFRKGDVSDLSNFRTGHYDLVTFTNSAHHFPKLEDVKKVLVAAEACVAPDGLVVMFDLARLKDQASTQAFIDLAGQDFKSRNMSAMYEDFKNSMFAAWLPEELGQAVPQASTREWVHIIPPGLTSFQAIVGLPVGQKKVFLRESFAWETTSLHQSEDAKQAWISYKQLLSSAQIKKAS